MAPPTAGVQKSSHDGMTFLPARLRIRVVVAASTLLPLSIASCGGGGGGSPPTPATTETSAGCLSCHGGIETIHVRFDLGCTDCHGGDAATTDLARAHVAPPAGPLGPADGVAPEDENLPFLRFVNPSDFRVLPMTCGRSGAGSGTNCHELEGMTVRRSIMATDAGLWQGLSWSSGGRASRTAGFGIFAETDADGVVPAERDAVLSLAPLPPEDASLPIDGAARHASSLPRESCVRCHLYSTGAGVRGESGHEGLYRSQGCAACHLVYDDDGLYKGGDPTIDKTEPGHGAEHFVTLAIPSSQCAHCHNSGGLDVGLSFAGLAEAPPGAPAGPGFAGTTDTRRYGAYHFADGYFVQPDVHAEAGMACIDCHTQLEAHGDGNIDTSMSLATEIRCEDCHGSLQADSTLTTSRGNPLPQLRLESGNVILRGKIDGIDRLVKQVRQVVDPDSPFYNPSGADAMNAAHLRPEGEGGLECYACHAPWQPGHYATTIERDFAAPGEDLVTGAPSPAALANSKAAYPSRAGLLRYRNFNLGRNARGRVAPFVPSRGGVLATATGAAGETLADAAFPLAADGRIGLTQAATFPHTTRLGARTCNECHRNPAAVGLGGDGLALARPLAAAALGAGGVDLLDRRDPAAVARLARIAVADARDALLVGDAATARARTLVVAAGAGGVLFFDVSAPDAPLAIATLPTTDARGLALAGSTLAVADGAGGVLFADVSVPESPRVLAGVPTADARSVAVGFPFVYVADGAGGLAVIDVADPAAPFLAETIDLNGADPAPNDARAAALFPLLAPIQGTDKPYQTIVAVADGPNGLRILDVTEPAFRFALSTFPATEAAHVAYASVVLPGDDATATRETDLLVVSDPAVGLHFVEMGTFGDLLPLGTLADPALSATACEIAFDASLAGGMRLLAHVATAAGELRVIDVTDPRTPLPLGAAALGFPALALALDTIDPARRVAEDGREILGTPFETSRSFDADEIRAILETEYP